MSSGDNPIVQVYEMLPQMSHFCADSSPLPSESIYFTCFMGGVSTQQKNDCYPKAPGEQTKELKYLWFLYMPS